MSDTAADHLCGVCTCGLLMYVRTENVPDTAWVAAIKQVYGTAERVAYLYTTTGGDTDNS